MAKVTLLFDVKAESLDDGRALVEAALGLHMELRSGTEREDYFVNAFASFTRLLSRSRWP